MNCLANCAQPQRSYYLVEACMWVILAGVISAVAWQFFHAQGVVTTAAWISGVHLSIAAGLVGLLAIYKIYLAYRPHA